MNWDRIQGNWKQLKGKVQQQWGHLTDDDIDVIDGRREELAGKLQERYAISREGAKRQVSDWQDKVDHQWFERESAIGR